MLDRPWLAWELKVQTVKEHIYKVVICIKPLVYALQVSALKLLSHGQIAMEQCIPRLTMQKQQICTSSCVSLPSA